MTAESLTGIRVLDLSRLLPGPYLTMVLADLGADVVKVEAPGLGDYLRQIPPTIDGVSGRFIAINRGKRSLVLDLKSEAGRDALVEMARHADVVVESFRPGVMDRLGLGFKRLSAANPKLIMCSISGYGQTGPYRQRAGHDLNYIGTAGVLGMGGDEASGPAMPGVQIADLAGGALWSATGILAALIGRERTGKGTHLDISMAEGALALLAGEIGSLDCGVAELSRGEGSLNGGLARYSVYRARDGKYLSIAALEPKFWIAFNEAIGRTPGPRDLFAPPQIQQAIREQIQSILETKTRDEWAVIFASHDCCCDAVLELDELSTHPQHEHRGVFVEGDSGVRQLRLPVGAPRTDRLAPTHGEHSAEILEEYGFSADVIAALVP